MLKIPLIVYIHIYLHVPPISVLVNLIQLYYSLEIALDCSVLDVEDPSRSIYTDMYIHVPSISVLVMVKNEGRYTGYGYLHRDCNFVPMTTRRTTHRRQQKCVKC
jgi:hypothetical protein